MAINFTFWKSDNSVSQAGYHRDSGLTKWYGRTFFSLDERINFFERLAELIEANFSILLALRTYHDGYQSKMDPSDTRLIFLRDVLGNMESGQSFSLAVSRWVSPTERVLLDAGEHSGHLSEALMACGQVARNTKEIKSSMRTQLIDPVINAVIFIGTAIYTARDILPVFTKMSNPSTWGSFLYYWYAVSEFFNHWLLFMVGFLAAYILFAWWTLPRVRDGKFRAVLEIFPPWSIYKRLQGAVFIDAMAAMLKGGTSFRRAIEKIREQASPYLQSKLDQALEKLMGNEDVIGKQSAEVFDVGLLPPESVVEIGIYAIGKRLTENLSKLAQFNTTATLNWISSRVGTIAMLVDLAAVMYTMLSLVAMMNLSQALGGG